MTAGLKDEATALAPITGADISEYLASVDDFAFEREIYSVARGLGFQTQHSALYADPVTQKIRDFDIRAWGSLRVCKIALAIECKGLSTDYPLLVSATGYQNLKVGY